MYSCPCLGVLTVAGGNTWAQTPTIPLSHMWVNNLQTFLEIFAFIAKCPNFEETLLCVEDNVMYSWFCFKIVWLGELLAAQEQETADIRGTWSHDQPLLQIWDLQSSQEYHRYNGYSKGHVLTEHKKNSPWGMTPMRLRLPKTMFIKGIFFGS